MRLLDAYHWRLAGDILGVAEPSCAARCAAAMDPAFPPADAWRLTVNREGQRRQKEALQAWRLATTVTCQKFVTAVGFAIECQVAGPWRPSSLLRWSRLLLELLQVWAVYNMGIWYPRGRLSPEAMGWARSRFNIPRRR